MCNASFVQVIFLSCSQDTAGQQYPADKSKRIKKAIAFLHTIALYLLTQ